MKKNYSQRLFAFVAIASLLIGNIDAQTTDKHRIWAKDANTLHDYYNWDNPIALVTAGSTNFNPAVEEIGLITEGVSNAWNNCFLKFENVDFGTFSDSLTFYRNVPRGAIVEFWIDRDETTHFDTFFNDGGYVSTANKNVIKLSGGTFLGSYQHWYNADGNWSRWEKHEIAINKTGGVHNLYVVFRAGGKTAVNQNLGGLYYIDLHRTLKDEITFLSATETAISLPIGAHHLQYTYEPSTASTEDLIWTVENESAEGVLSVNNDGSVIAMRPGTATVKCTSSRAAGDISLTYDITVVGTSTEEQFVVEAENADILYITYNPTPAQSFAIGSLQESGGGDGINYAWNTNFAIYENVDFGSFTDNMKFRHAEIRGGAVEFWIDREIIDERHPNRLNTGDYYNPSGKELAGGTFLGRYEFLKSNDFSGGAASWKEFDLPITPTSGVHDLYVVFLRGGKGTYEKTVGHWDWFKLNRNYADIYQIIPSEDNIRLKKNEEETITLQIVPEVVYNDNVIWSVVEGSDVVSVDENGKITALALGTAKVRATAEANDDIYAEINVIVDTSTGINGSEVELWYPNPITNNLKLRSNTAFENIIISNISGQVVFQQNKLQNTEINVDSSAWSTGLYFVKIKTEEGTNTLKIIKQ